MDETVKLNDIFNQFKIQANCVRFNQHKHSYHYDVALKPGFRIKSLERYLNEISMALRTQSKATLQVIPEQGIVRIEYINSKRDHLDLFALGYTATRPFGKLPSLLGETLQGEPFWFDITDAPHCLVAGTTGSGKTSLLHNIIANLIINNNSHISLIDTKNVEFSKYKGKYSNIGVYTEYTECLNLFNSLYKEMETRYSLIRDGAEVNKNFPYRVVIIDEFADLIMQDQKHSLRSMVCRLAQKCRAAGIHIVLATQRPSYDIIDGNIKANFPTRIACKTASSIDSRIILDDVGAEKLQGRGDAIFKSNNHIRFQVAYTDPNITSKYLGNV